MELVVLALIAIVLVFYFFYWNRFFAFLFGVLARFALWNQAEYSIWVELGKAYIPLVMVVGEYS